MTDTTEFGAGVGLRGAAGGGASVSANAAARPWLARAATGLSLAPAARDGTLGKAGFKENSSSVDGPVATLMTPPHTEQRARTDVGGNLAGSTRKTERHSGQETFTYPPSRPACPVASLAAARSPGAHPADDRSRRRIREAF